MKSSRVQAGESPGTKIEVNPESITMEVNRSPFRYGVDFGLDDIVGRKDEIAHVERVLRDGMRLFLSGPRGFGKTSILRAAQTNLSRKGAIVLYVNAETSPDVGHMTMDHRRRR